MPSCRNLAGSLLGEVLVVGVSVGGEGYHHVEAEWDACRVSCQCSMSGSMSAQAHMSANMSGLSGKLVL